MPRDRAHAPVGFDEAVWKEDLRSSTDAGRTAAASKRAELERDSPSTSCSPVTPKRRMGPACPTASRPTFRGPTGSGASYLIARDPNTGRLSLDVLSFGVRHHPQGSHAPTVYERAHRRMHGQPPRR